MSMAAFPDDPVVVTGLGAVSGYGAGVAALWAGLRSGQACIADFKRFDHARDRTHLAAEVPVHTLPAPAGPKEARRLTLADRFALAAADEAVAAAGGVRALREARAGVFFGSSTGGFYESERFFADIIGAGRGRAHIDALTAQQYNGPGDAVARRFDVRGPVATLSSACTSGALAVAAALEALDDGEIDVALAGGADSLCRITYAGFNSMRAVDPAPCRPFREDRAGLSLGEGAAVLVLERRSRALARSFRPIATLLGAGSTCDAHHMTAPIPDGSGACRAALEAIRHAGIEPREVAFVNLHGTGTPLNDAAEWMALCGLFGARAAEVPVTSTKGALGHLLGSAGAIEALATVLCLAHGEVHATPGVGPVDPATPARLVLGSPLAVPRARFALSLNLAFGGSNAALVFGRWEEP